MPRARGKGCRTLKGIGPRSNGVFSSHSLVCRGERAMREPTTIHSVDLRYVMRRCAITQIGSVCLFATLAGGIITACATGDQNANGPGDDAGIVQPSSGVASCSGG